MQHTHTYTLCVVSGQAAGGATPRLPWCIATGQHGVFRAAGPHRSSPNQPPYTCHSCRQRAHTHSTHTTSPHANIPGIVVAPCTHICCPSPQEKTPNSQKLRGPRTPWRWRVPVEEACMSQCRRISTPRPCTRLPARVGCRCRKPMAQGQQPAPAGSREQPESDGAMSAPLKASSLNVRSLHVCACRATISCSCSASAAGCAEHPCGLFLGVHAICHAMGWSSVSVSLLALRPPLHFLGHAMPLAAARHHSCSSSSIMQGEHSPASVQIRLTGSCNSK